MAEQRLDADQENPSRSAAAQPYQLTHQTAHDLRFGHSSACSQARTVWKAVTKVTGRMALGQRAQRAQGTAAQHRMHILASHESCSQYRQAQVSERRWRSPVPCRVTSPMKEQTLPITAAVAIHPESFALIEAVLTYGARRTRGKPWLT